MSGEQISQAFPMVTRRRLLRWSAAGSAFGLGTTMLASAPWRAAFGEAKPYKIGTMQPAKTPDKVHPALSRLAASTAK